MMMKGREKVKPGAGSARLEFSTPSFQRPKTLPPSSGNVEELSVSLANSRLRLRLE